MIIKTSKYNVMIVSPYVFFQKKAKFHEIFFFKIKKEDH